MTQGSEQRAPERVLGVLGPTNTGKTHYAIERMLAHRTGIIGLQIHGGAKAKAYYKDITIDVLK